MINIFKLRLALVLLYYLFIIVEASSGMNKGNSTDNYENNSKQSISHISTSTRSNDVKLSIESFLTKTLDEKILFKEHPYLIMKNETQIHDTIVGDKMMKEFCYHKYNYDSSLVLFNESALSLSFSSHSNSSATLETCSTSFPSLSRSNRHSNDIKEEEEEEEEHFTKFNHSDVLKHYNNKNLARSINHILANVSLEMVELGPSMWCLLYLMTSMIVPLIFLIAFLYIVFDLFLLIIVVIVPYVISIYRSSSNILISSRTSLTRIGAKNKEHKKRQHQEQKERDQHHHDHCNHHLDCSNNHEHYHYAHRCRRVELMGNICLWCWSFMFQDTSYFLEYGYMKFYMLYVVVVGITCTCLLQFHNNNSNMYVSSTSTMPPIHHNKNRFLYRRAFPMFVITIIWFHCIKHTNEDLPMLYNPTSPTASSHQLELIRPGLYYNNHNSIIQTIVNNWPKHFWTYDDDDSKTPFWILNGDMRTGLPFLFNSIEQYKNITFITRWLPLKDEGEAIMLDIAFPKDGYIHFNRPIYVILHGINGGSKEGYVLDFISRAISYQSTVIVMNTRGLNNSPIIGNNLMHFARISDFNETLNVLRKALGRNVFIGGIGYSMGAITLANYVARSGLECQLNGAVAISGSLNPLIQPHYKHSARVWQPMIVKAMRDTLLQPNIWNKIQRHLSNNLEQEDILKSQTMMDLDKSFFVKYHGYQNLQHYYNEMGAMTHITNVSIPLLTIHSMDDPIAYWKCYFLPPSLSSSRYKVVVNQNTFTSLIDNAVNSGKGFIVQLWTQKGGHVGWPTSIKNHPWKLDGWKWMNDASISFLNATMNATGISTVLNDILRDGNG